MNNPDNNGFLDQLPYDTYLESKVSNMPEPIDVDVDVIDEFIRARDERIKRMLEVKPLED